MVSLVVTTGLQEALIPLATTQKLCTGSRALSPWWPLNVADSCWSTVLDGRSYQRAQQQSWRHATLYCICSSILKVLVTPN